MTQNITVVPLEEWKLFELFFLNTDIFGFLIYLQKQYVSCFQVTGMS